MIKSIIKDTVRSVGKSTVKSMGMSWSQYWATRFPSDLILTISSPTQIDLSWTNNGVSDYEGISIERSTDGVNFSELATIAAGEATYSDTVATTATPYWYKIRYYKSENYTPPVVYEIINSELTTYITGLATQLSDLQLAKLDTLISSLKTGLSITNLSDFFDVLRILAGETAESSLKNLAKNSHHCSAIGSPTFTQYEGWVGNTGGTAYLTSDYQPSVNAVRYGLNDCAIGMYNRTTGTNSLNGAYRLNGASTSMINCDPSYYSRGQINDTSYGTVTVSASAGMRVTTRRSAGSFYHNVNNSEALSGRAAVALPNSFELVGYGANGQISCVFASKACSQAQITVIRNAVEAYMDANGKGVL